MVHAYLGKARNMTADKRMKRICPSGAGSETWHRGRDGNPVNPEIRCHIMLTRLP
ncbi:Uncharacterized protein dnm_004310 [Desulfonema magnum]|uniref:Uncharacterized protein n=1 Tax=Desulfonema magnum TaxID=45655 RepID=A0A975GKE6_9BACT|nr:Uncharacterized protein dnm_004310 [Desulfonema magnum]